MDLLINIISIVGPLIFAACLFALKNISTEIKIGLWIICALILIFNLYLIIKDKKIRKKNLKEKNFIIAYTKDRNYSTETYRAP